MDFSFFQILWFVILALVWVIYIVQDGFILGSSFLSLLICNDEDERKQIQTINGLHWDGIEVWLIVAVGGLFASFPHIFGQLFSLLYVPVYLLLFCIIFRGVSIELLYKHRNPDYVSVMSKIWAISSAVFLIVLGTYLTSIFFGFDIEADGSHGSFLQIFNLAGLSGAITFLMIGIITGTGWIAMMTKGDLAQRALKYAKLASYVALITGSLALIGLNNKGFAFKNDLFVQNPILWVIPFLSLITLVLTAIATSKGKFILMFIFGSLFYTTYITAGYVGTYPYMIPSNVDPSYGLTLFEGSSSLLTLQILTVGALIFVPIVLIYQARKYFVFRNKVKLGDR